MTPGLAAAWLAATVPLRPPWQPVSQRIAADIEAGLWQSERSEPLRLIATGLDGDGRHRLAAIVASGIAVPMRVEGLHEHDEQAAAADQLRVARS